MLHVFILSSTSFRIFFVLLFCITPQIRQNQYHQWCDPWVIQSDKEINGAEQIFVCGVAQASCLLATHACWQRQQDRSEYPRLATMRTMLGRDVEVGVFAFDSSNALVWPWDVSNWRCGTDSEALYHPHPHPKKTARTKDRQTNECLGTTISAFGLPFTWSPWHSWVLFVYLLRRII